MEHDLDTNQGDGNLESPFPPLRHLTLVLYYIPYTRATTAWGITPLTHSILPLLLQLLFLGPLNDGRGT